MSSKTKSDRKILNFDTNVCKILQLMAKSVYVNKEVFLRELISNASDACDKLRYNALKDSDLLSEDHDLKIIVKVDKDKNTITVSDNGIGMNEKDLINNIGTIANSGTEKFIENLKDNKKDVGTLIGQFGIGFYSTFMVADKVTIYSTKAGTKKTYVWESDGSGKYSLSQHNEKLPRGTTVELNIKKDETDLLEDYKIREIIKKYSDHISFPINFINNEKKESLVNEGSAIWTRSKSEVTQEQETEFYRSVSKQYGKPWLTVRNKVEGNVGYTSLLFIPDSPIHNILYQDYKPHLKLYIKRVFISDEVRDIVPNYLRFLSGVIDSEDIPLNISRETLQNNQNILTIRKSITKKVLSAFDKAQSKDDYNKFWQNFGSVLKEGLYFDQEVDSKDQILKLCRFYSTRSEDNLISLNQYIDNIKDGQDKIYYYIGDNLESLKNNPQLEGFKKNDIEVLLLTDRIDNLWISSVREYKDKQFKSITSSDIDLNKIKRDDKKEDVIEGEIEDESEDKLIDKFKEILGDKVKDIKISKKLIDVPVCLSDSDDGMGFNIQSMLRDKLVNSNSMKTLEINTTHPVIDKIKKIIMSSSDDESGKSKAQGLIEMMFYEACIIEGQKITNSKEFAQTLNSLLTE